MQRIEEDLLKIDSAEREDTVFMALNHIRVANARALLPAGLQNYVRVDPDRNTVAITGPVAQRTRVIGQLRRLDIPLPPVAVDATNLHRTHVVKLNNVSPETAVNLLPDAAAAYVRGDDASGAVAVSAPKHLVDELIADIRRIDVKRQHVMLDARVVVLEQSDLLNFGTNFNWPTIQAGSSYMDGGDAYEVRIGYTPSRTFTDALQLTLNLLSANQEATILASPQVLAQDGVELEIRVTNEEYFQITAPEGNFIQSDLEKIETGTILSITPRIGDDGSITLSLELEVSDVVARGQQDLPVVNRRAARSTIRTRERWHRRRRRPRRQPQRNHRDRRSGSAPIALPWPGLSHRQAHTSRKSGRDLHHRDSSSRKARTHSQCSALNADRSRASTRPPIAANSNAPCNNSG